MASFLGSSPRMRGAQRSSFLHLDRHRIIPAYAGSTLAANANGDCDVDHPRVCGEHPCPSVQRIGGNGSSPRMRGARPTPTPKCLASRIIPAYAGSTLCSASSTEYAKDHPRVCGEHIGIQRRVGILGGSSPRMRGAPLFCTFQAFQLGIIPAYAGSTNQLMTLYICYRDHPRVCGEHMAVGDEPGGIAGSSPRMRGALAILDLLAGRARIIPAYAGSTLFLYIPFL